MLEIVSLHAILRKTYNSNSIKWQEKPHFGPDLGQFDPNSWALNFLFMILNNAVNQLTFFYLEE